MLPGMWCPYCGDEMRPGVVRLRGQWTAGLFAGVLGVNFEIDDGSGEGSELLPRGRFRVRSRSALCCVRCEAVLVDPKSGPAPTTPATRAGASAPVGSALHDEDTDAEDAEAAAASSPATNGNGSSALPATPDPPSAD
jgi:hypothetical protein